MKLDAYFYHKNREVYDRVKNPAVLFLRKTKYAAFPLAVLAFKRRRDSYKGDYKNLNETKDRINTFFKYKDLLRELVVRDV